MANQTNNSQYKVFIVDDEPMIRKMLEFKLKERSDLQVSTFSTGEACLENLEKEGPDIVILDYHMDTVNEKAMNGLATLNKIKEVEPTTKVAMLSSQDNVHVAVDVLKQGAVDYIVKNAVFAVNTESSIDKIIQGLQLQNEIRQLTETIKRDKLMIRGYFVSFLLFLMVAYYLFVVR